MRVIGYHFQELRLPNSPHAPESDASSPLQVCVAASPVYLIAGGSADLGSSSVWDAKPNATWASVAQ